ncbi:cysteine--tRNA ligase-like protein, mitochondrial [Lycorma delicatula]|uniref:cysteine--tRNA ligase-like protein, mitochondrial n=1 Tax=Lycorma delicatula TaxID=130591 RepID=UPI003F51118C
MMSPKYFCFNKSFYFKRYFKCCNSFYRGLHSERSCVKRSGLWVQPIGYDTGIKIYNPILKEKVNLVLKTKNIATWYSCGPTVYDSSHLGHASCYVKFDIIRRILEEWFNINVIMVMGITDIDDKIIQKANEKNTDFSTISRKYEIEFYNDLENLGILMPTLFARVTDYIPNIIDFIKKIIAEGYAYITPSGSVYFQTSKYERYNRFGSASDENISQYIDEEKQSPLDFALWKAAKSDEPYWKSPWGFGRPGWHIECSAIASEFFGSNFDIHSGGVDLKFPHHENEEAQSCAHHSVDQWVNFWIHSGHLQLKGNEKMSKSLKNTISIDNFLKSNSSNEFRIMCLMSPYRNGFVFNDDAIKTASGIYRRMESFIHTCDAYVKGLLNHGSVDEESLLKKLLQTKDEMYVNFTDDFNTPKALSNLLELISATNEMIYNKSQDIVRRPAAVAAVSYFVKETLRKWGLNLDYVNKEVGNESIVSNVLDTAVEFRCKVREIIHSAGKNVSEDAKVQSRKLFHCCDEFRNDLNDLGIQLEDHRGKSSWKFKENIKKKEKSEQKE